MTSFNSEEVMDTKMTFLFCLCDEFLKSIGLQDDDQCRMSPAEIMTFPLTSALFFNPTIKTQFATLFLEIGINRCPPSTA